jgi:anti-sigma factor RsiW
MTSPKLNISDIDLHAYVDGRLSDERRREVDAFLATTPPAEERMRAYREQNRLLHVLFDSVLTEPVPGKWQRPGRRWTFFLKPAAAALAWIVMGGVVGWLLRGQDLGKSPGNVDFARSAAIAHAVYSPEVRHPVEVTAEQEQHLVNWLSKRLGDHLRVPHLADLGYELVGGRLLPGDQGPVAQFMYQNKNGQRLTLYIKTDSNAEQETAFRFAQEGKIGVFYWIDRRLSYALSGEVEKPELLKVANEIYLKLNP